MAFASSRIGAQDAIIKPCDLCEDDENVNWFCKDCDQTLCDRCRRLHLRSNVSKSHIMLSIADGFTMEKRNISNMCRDHDQPFSFLCKTCTKNVCSICLSTKHKKHDFIDLRVQMLEIQKQIEGIIELKEEEKHRMRKNYEELVEHESQLENHLKEECANINDKVKSIKLAADEEGERLKESLNSAIHQRDKEVKEEKLKIQARMRHYDEEIKTVQQELHLQNATSLNTFLKESTTKLTSLQPMSITIPNMKPSSEEKVDKNQIRQMMGKVGLAQMVSSEDVKRVDATLCNAVTDLNIIKINQFTLFNCDTGNMCTSPDGSIWISDAFLVYKTSSDFSRVLRMIKIKDTSIIANVVTDFSRHLRGEHEYIPRITCDRHGNALVTTEDKRIYLLSQNGEILKVFTVKCDEIRGIAVNHDDHLMVHVYGNSKNRILVAKYLD